MSKDAAHCSLDRESDRYSKLLFKAKADIKDNFNIYRIFKKHNIFNKLNLIVLILNLKFFPQFLWISLLIAFLRNIFLVAQERPERISLPSITPI